MKGKRTRPNYINSLSQTDRDIIVSWIPEGSRVLDLGCGDCSLLRELLRLKAVDGMGVDISGERLIRGIELGVPVYQGDLDDGLADFPDGSRDYVILNQTLQVVKNPVLAIREMLRIGRFGIVGFPNFGYWALRMGLVARGRAPKSPALPFEWYDTPNIRVLTIKDFRCFCSEEGIRIVQETFLMFSRWRKARTLRPLANVFSHMGLFVIARDHGR
jgi:methionine biosynthesis protein MetW